MIVETNLGSHQENNIIRPISLNSWPGTHVNFLLMHVKLTTATFLRCFDKSFALFSPQLIFSSKIKKKTQLPLILPSSTTVKLIAVSF